MNLKDIINKIFQRKDPVALAQKGIEQVQEVIEYAEQDKTDNVVDDTVKVAIEATEKLTIKMSEEQKGIFAQEVAKFLVQKPEIPNDVPTEYIGTMMKNEDIPNKYIIKPAKALPDSKLSKITQKTSIPIDDRKELLGSIEDKKIKQQQQEQLEQEEKRIIEMKKRRVIDSLERIYEKCEEIPSDSDISDQIYNILYTDNRTLTENARYLSKEEIEKEKAKIIAKRIAYNMNRFGYTRLQYLSKTLSAKDMKRLEVISMAIDEYSKIEEKNRKFNEEQLVADIAGMESKDIEENVYNEKQEFEKIIYKLLQLSPEERKDIIKKINNYVSRKISEKNNAKPNFEDNGLGNNIGPEI